MELRYLGTAGWHLRTAHSSLLVDPYFTRLPLGRMLAGYAVSDRALVEAYTPPADWVLVTHAHYDHLMDVPETARLTGAQVYASPQACELLALQGVPPHQVTVIGAGDRLVLGDFEVEVYPSRHRVIFGHIPYQKPLRPRLKPPLRARDYRFDHLFTFRICAQETRVLVASGIDAEPSVEADVLLVGADASRDQLAVILEGVRPRLVMPNHWDDMFRPLSLPLVPMYRPPKGIIPSLKRIDLAAFERWVREIAPEAQVIVPRLFASYEIARS